ncbi:MAG: hypothetical protein QF662_04770, partial [Phycisphaerae bacterium]|nr:hypothetical protein [Phycisphaerae bacterium]
WCDFPGAGDITVGGGIYDVNYKMKEWGRRYQKLMAEMEATKPLVRQPGEVIMDVPLRQLWTDPVAEGKFWDDARALLRDHKFIDFNFVADDSTVVYNERYTGGRRDDAIPGGLGKQKKEKI